MKESLLEVSDLEVRYGAAVAVRGVSLSVRRGQFVAVLGNNGAGKSSIVRSIAGLVVPHRGEVKFLGEDTTRLSADQKARRGLVMVPEGRLLFSDQTVEDNLILGAYVHRGLKQRASRAVFEDVIERFPRLKERLHQKAGSMSGGEQQTLAIARGLMARPTLLIIDELSLGLAPKIVDDLMSVLADLNKGGLTIVLVEQLASFALAVADYGVVVSNGRITRQGSSTELVRDPEIIESFLGTKRATQNPMH